MFRAKSYSYCTNLLIAAIFLVEPKSAFAGEGVVRTQIEAEKRATANGENVEKPLDKQGFKDRYRPEEAEDKAYGFFVRALKRDKIPSKLKETYDNQKVELKQQYQDMFPHLEDRIAVKSAGSKEVGQTTRQSFPKAIAAELVDSITWLKSFTKKLSFKFDLFGGSKTASNEPPKPMRYGLAKNQDGSPSSAVSANGNSTSAAAGVGAGAGTNHTASDSRPIGPIVAREQDEHTDSSGGPNSKHASKFSDLGKFQGGVATGVEDSLAQSSTTANGPESAAFSLYLAQKNNYYRLTAPVGAGQKSNAISHELQLPVYQNMRLGRTLDYKGGTVKTSWLNILNSETGKAAMNLHYLHAEDKYSGEAVFQLAKNEQVTFETKTPSELKPRGNEFGEKGAEYKVSYALAI